jgi:hypothetical protein
MKTFALTLFTAALALTSITSVQALPPDRVSSECKNSPYLPSCDPGSGGPFPTSAEEQKQIEQYNDKKREVQQRARCQKIKDKEKRAQCLDSI